MVGPDQPLAPRKAANVAKGLRGVASAASSDARGKCAPAARG
ncbi:MAG: hypothetical protein ACK5V0_11775 [Alphaproteobacteria bacterium]